MKIFLSTLSLIFLLIQAENAELELSENQKLADAHLRKIITHVKLKQTDQAKKLIHDSFKIKIASAQSSVDGFLSSLEAKNVDESHLPKPEPVVEDEENVVLVYVFQGNGSHFEMLTNTTMGGAEGNLLNSAEMRFVRDVEGDNFTF